MASGNTLIYFNPNANEPPASNYATLDNRNGHPVLDFDASTDESAVFSGVMPRHYGGSGITVTLGIMFTSATSGAAMFRAALERNHDNGDDLDSDSFASSKPVSVSANATSGKLTYATIAFTNGAEMDSTAAGEFFRLKVYRDADASESGTDDATGDAELLGIEVKES